MTAAVMANQNWAETTLGGVCEFFAGYAFPPSMQGLRGQKIPFYKVKDISAAWNAKSTLCLETEHTLSDEQVASLHARPLPAGTVIFAKIGEALRLNRRAILPRPALVDNNVMGIRALDGLVDSRFLFWFSMATKFDDGARASVVPSIRKSDIEQIRFSLPPRAEQTRIVDKLEELLSDLDAGVAELKAAQKKLAQYRQSLLKVAVEGKLTAAWREKNGEPEESGAQLLARILRERRARWETRQLAKFEAQGKVPPSGWQGKYPEPIAPDVTELPDLPQGWVWASLDMLGEIVGGVAKGTKRDERVAVSEVHYLRVANVQRGYLDLSEVKTILANERDIAELTLEDGDVLFNEGGDRDKLGRGWVWRNEVEACIHQNHVFRMRPILPELRPELISHHGNTFGKLWFQTAGKQTTNLASINMGMLREFPVSLAPVAEQTEILLQLQIKLALIAEQDASTEHALRQSAAQRKNILKAAFSGQLVPQDSNDEPASVLLERIRVERAARTMAAAGRGRKSRTAA